MISPVLADVRREGKAEGRAEAGAENVAYVMKHHDMSFEEATAFLGIQGEDKESCRAVIEKKEEALTV